MKTSGRSIIMKSVIAICAYDLTRKNARGKKTAWTKAETKKASRNFRHNKNWKIEAA